MKKIISKFNIIFLGILILSFSGNYIFASTLVDVNKAYDICMKYHPPRIQGLCSQISAGTTFEQILGEHTRHGSAEVEAEKDNMLASTTSENNDTSKENTEQTTTNEQTTPTTNEQTTPTQPATTDKSTSSESKTNTTTKKATPEENKILTFAYSSWFWTLINIVGVAFFVITYLVDRYKYFKRKNKRSKK